MCKVYGPAELRITWQSDEEEPLHDDTLGEEYMREFWRAVEIYGVYGCTVEIRKPVCPCCGRKEWEHAASLWGIIGDDEYHREIEKDLMSEAR